MKIDQLLQNISTEISDSGHFWWNSFRDAPESGNSEGTNLFRFMKNSTTTKTPLSLLPPVPSIRRSAFCFPVS